MIPIKVPISDLYIGLYQSPNHQSVVRIHFCDSLNSHKWCGDLIYISCDGISCITGIYDNLHDIDATAMRKLKITGIDEI